MKSKNLLWVALIVAASITSLVSFTQKTAEVEYLQISTIESVVAGGLGRSRMVSINSDGDLQEEKMENFFSLTGINFGNIRNNDRMITDKITQLTNEGWTLDHLTTGVYGAEKSTGIFITRYLFKKGGN